MRAVRVNAASSDLLDLNSAIWGKAEQSVIDLFPTPLGMVEEKSPFLALSQDHGTIKSLAVASVHNAEDIALRLSWAAPVKHDKLKDLNVFVDGAAVLFALSPRTQAITMGSPDAPANAWYWKANMVEPYDVLSHGFGSTERRPGAACHLRVAGSHDGTNWHVVFVRPLALKGDGFVQFTPGKSAKVAFTAWDGANAERSGRKAFSGDFIELEIQK